MLNGTTDYRCPVGADMLKSTAFRCQSAIKLWYYEEPYFVAKLVQWLGVDTQSFSARHQRHLITLHSRRCH